MSSNQKDSVRWFSDYVNPEEAALFKLANIDKRYVKAEGMTLTDENGKQYLDFCAGYGALNLGHNPPEVIKAVNEAHALPAVLLAGYNPLAGALAHNLSLLLPDNMTHAIFGNGGAEAVEIALKTARAATRRKRFVSCANGYHGLSYGAVSVGRSSKHNEHLGPLLEHCHQLPFGDAPALEEALKAKDVAAFIVEPIQGEGGIRIPPAGYLKAAEEICRKHGTMLILDEIQTGFGRTGKMFALEHERVVPDILTTSKSLGSGVVPISASITSEEVWKKAFGHRDKFDMIISTFGGNPSACAAALKTIEIMRRDGIPERAGEVGEYAKDRLDGLKESHKLVGDVRGKGLFIGIELKAPRIGGGFMEENLSAMVITSLLNEHGILTSYCDLDSTVVRFEPPLIVTKSQIDFAVESLDAVLGKGSLGLTMSFGKSAVSRKLSSR